MKANNSSSINSKKLDIEDVSSTNGDGFVKDYVVNLRTTLRVK